ncbi:hypothetical protein KC19_9G007000 [Ceratodon purpureus]|uniref:Uncharacterized protein n=1 Tax=Ceratodon purpureus TaxID=3225 RepID=A0A8T0GP63_CERPU|nr:hypothetical protein KC19_9G007000 [Ceratodon purpureus]
MSAFGSFVSQSIDSERCQRECDHLQVLVAKGTKGVGSYKLVAHLHLGVLHLQICAPSQSAQPPCSIDFQYVLEVLHIPITGSDSKTPLGQAPIICILEAKGGHGGLVTLSKIFESEDAALQEVRGQRASFKTRPLRKRF